MPLSDRARRTASLIKSYYRKTRIWKIEDLKLGYVSIPKYTSDLDKFDYREELEALLK